MSWGYTIKEAIALGAIAFALMWFVLYQIDKAQAEGNELFWLIKLEYGVKPMVVLLDDFEGTIEECRYEAWKMQLDHDTYIACVHVGDTY